MREFYKERNVVIEERRMRTDSNPIGRLLEQFTTAAFQAHPYHRPDRRLDVRSEFILRHRRAELLRRVLHSVEHGGRRGRRREGCQRRCPSSRNISDASLHARSPTSAPPPSRRRTPSAASCCKTARSRSTSRAITGPTTATRRRRLRRHRRPDVRTAAPRASIAPWCAIRRSPPTPPASPACPGIKYPHLFAFYAVPAARPQDRRNGGCDPR